MLTETPDQPTHDHAEITALIDAAVRHQDEPDPLLDLHGDDVLVDGGRHYAAGEITPADPERAAAYFGRACELRFQAGCLNLIEDDQLLAAAPRELDLREVVAVDVGGRQGGRVGLEDGAVGAAHADEGGQGVSCTTVPVTIAGHSLVNASRGHSEGRAGPARAADADLASKHLRSHGAEQR